jgi:phosphoglycerol transferase
LEIKAIVDNGWCLTVPQLGAPSVLRLHDFPPQFDSLHLLVIRLMSVFIHDWALIFNLYFLLGFPLIAVSSVAVFRHFGVSRWSAIAASVLYAFLPSRLIKGQAHLFLDTFFQVPFAILLMLWVCGDLPALRSRRSLVGLLVALLLGATGLYYAFFSACLLLLAGSWAAIVRRSPRNFLAGVTLAAVIGLTVGAQDIPTALYRSMNGVNIEVANRLPGESEVYGLRIAQLLLPISGHRVPYLRNLEDRYKASAPMPGEYLSTSLGIVASLGFLVLLGTSLLGFARTAESLDSNVWRPLASLNLSAVLLGTIGGFGSLFALLVSPQIRTYCRLNVFIAFMALFAVVLLVDRLRRSRPLLADAVAGAALIVGILDQTTHVHRDPSTAIRYASDGELVSQIEHDVPAGAMIYELPFGTFPESLDDYVLVRPYLHSHLLRWSYPAMRGREGGRWAHDTAALDPAGLLSVVRQSGFAGILIDRDIYRDRGAAIESRLVAMLGRPPRVSRDGNLAFFRVS